jgi:UDP-2,3-diacylglucosamine pyrophosphatase LpxH
MDDSIEIVISDLHIGVGDAFDIFHAPGKVDSVARFVDYVRSQPSPVELVINGDMVDFLQVKPWDDYSHDTAVQKIRAITTGSSAVFTALGGLLNDARHRITILLGNHDIELAYDDVWSVLRDAILVGAPSGAKDRLQLISRRITHRPHVNGVLIHIEHGNLDDPYNTFNYNTLFNDAETGASQLTYPPGTQFVYDTINGVKQELQFVDVLKPEMPAVVLLLMALRPWKSIKNVPNSALNAVRAIKEGWVNALRQAAAGKPLGPPIGAATQTPSETLGAAMALQYGDVPGEPPMTLGTVDDLKYVLDEYEQPAESSATTLGGRSDAIKVRLITAALWSLARFRSLRASASEFSTADFPDDHFAKSARGRIQGNVKVVVYGHTHEALKTAFGPAVYVNSGTWANLVRMPRSSDYKELLEWLRKLSDNTFDRTSFPTFVEITPSSAGARVSLCAWNSGGKKELWTSDISR